jgi:ribA/ribD-fused uncharacterized protein
MSNESTEITFYELPFYMFSNFSSFVVSYQDRDWMTSEHAYQAMKFESRKMQEMIRNCRSAHDAMKAAQSLPEHYRPDWEKVKVPIMHAICRQKLFQHEYIQRKLLETGDRQLVESSPIDSFWGWGPNKDGLNHLGKIWMQLRDELRTLIEESTKEKQ